MVTREGLRRRALLGLRSALWDGNFVDLVQWLSSRAVEHEHVAALGGQQNRWDLATTGRELDQRRLRTEIVVPHVVMHGLEDPAWLARVHIERDECGAVLLLLIRAQRRVVVARRVAHRKVDETELFVTDACRPHVRRAQRVRLAVRRQLCDLGLIDVPGKAQLTGHRVVPSNDARCRPAALTIEHLMPGDDDPPHDDRGRSDGGRPTNHGCETAPVSLSFCASPTLRSAEPFLPKSWHG